jgi:hypothetical protein
MTAQLVLGNGLILGRGFGGGQDRKDAPALNGQTVMLQDRIAGRYRYNPAGVNQGVYLHGMPARLGVRL